jgi:iron complex outermembrane receptor protein
MGGHGLELVIRGQQQNQLNIIDAGSFTYGACPNRMDPPTSTASLKRADTIIVEKGYASVTHGPGGSGGTVILERDAPQLDEGKRIEGTFVAGTGTNGTGTEFGGTLAVDLGRGFYIEGALERKSGDNYTDGSGRTVRSAFDQTNAGITLGYVGNGVDLAFDVDYALAEDVLFPGAGMDSPLDENFVYRLRGGVDVSAGALTRIEGNLYYSTVDHVMDNYSLRPVGMMAMRTPSTSDTIGGKIEAHLSFGATEAKLGVDYQSNNRFAAMYAGMPGMIPRLDAADPSRARFLMWPDVTIAQTGVYFESETDLSDRTRLKLGARYDHVRAKAGAANVSPALDGGRTPNTYYLAQYGTTFNSARTEDNVGGLIRLEYDVTPDIMVFGGLSRSVRTADATERAMGRANWVGNPDIKPEKHHQLDLGLQIDKGHWYLNASAYTDWVDDYILRDQFSVPGVITYRNISARLSGVELSAGWERNGWEIWGDATYTHGQNETFNAPLAQIPPLQGQVSVAYGQDGWRAGARVNWADDQDRIDLFRDPGATNGYTTLDLFGSYEVHDSTVLMAGMNNVTDETYANHLSRANLFDPAVTQVNEPGRTFYIKLESKF